jgi:hypothetical protein
MSEPVEAAIEIALLDEATSFAAAQGLMIAMPRVVVTRGSTFDNEANLARVGQPELTTRLRAPSAHQMRNLSLRPVRFRN